eukprot:8762375-Pyramimonas_sp.AAC.1
MRVSSSIQMSPSHRLLPLSIVLRLIYTQVHSYSYSDSLMLIRTHTQTHSPFKRGSARDLGQLPNPASLSQVANDANLKKPPHPELTNAGQPGI